MLKTKLGISVGLMGAATYFTCLFGGYVCTIVVVGYILLVENNEWLRKTGVKALLLSIVFSVLPAVVNLIPNAIDIVNNIFNIFGGSFHSNIVTSIISMIIRAISVLEILLFIALGLKAFNQGTLSVPIVDDITNKNME